METERWHTPSEGTDGFLETPALEVAAEALAMSAAAAGETGTTTLRSLPAAIGRYRIVRLLGEGGMGTVYEAEQEQPRRFVALKVIRPGLATPERLWRFTHEAQALGRLQHPGIAQIYEASTADTGFGPQPYFAMELIRGQALHQYAAAHQLNTGQRLALMVKICEAVHHAHQRGVIHRDLKPGNIVVDETGQPKILDFGVARVTESDAQATRQTDLGQIVGTLAYMSPEQVLADPLEVDTRSDVYSLGVILYELLSGRLPYDVNRRQLHEAVQTIREEDPVSLSSIGRHYRGDVETIVGKALEKDKARRYASAADLAADLQRYLSDEPITARPPSASYQLQKFARRHRALVAGVTAVFVALVAGVGASTSQAIRANRASQAATRQRDLALSAQQAATRERNRALAEKQRADDEAATSKAVSNFLQQDLLAQASANKQARRDSRPDPDLKVRTALDRAAAGIAGKFEKQPLVEASIRQTIGLTYRDLGIYPEAQKQLEAALSLRWRLLGEEHPDTVAAMNDLAVLYRDQSKFAQAESLLTRVLEIQRRSLGEDHPDTVRSIHDLAKVYDDESKFAQAEPLYVEALNARRRLLGKEHPDTLVSMTDLGWLYGERGNYGQAERLVAEALSVQRRVLGNEHPDTLNSMNTLAVVYRTEGKPVQAEPLYLEALDVQRRVLGENHPDTLISMTNLASLYRVEGKYAQAEALQTAALAIQRRVLGDVHSDTLATMNNVAVLYQLEGRYEEAESLLTKVLETRRRVLGEENPSTALSMNNLSVLYRIQGKFADAEPLMTKTLAVRRRVLGEENPITLLTMGNQAFLYQMQGKYGQAEALSTKALEVLRRVEGEENPDTLTSMTTVGLLYRSEGKFAQSEPLLIKVLELRRRVLGPEHPDALTSMHNLANLYRSEGKSTEAAALLTSVLEARRRVLGPSHPDTTAVMSLLGEVRLQQKEFDTAETLLREVRNGDAKTAVETWRRYWSQSLLGASLAGRAKYAEAEPLLVSGYQGMIERAASIPFEDRLALREAGQRIVQLYESWGKPDRAAEWREQLQRE